MASQQYAPKQTVEWESSEAHSQFRLWRKEVERIIKGPLTSFDDDAKMNHVYIWAGAYAEELVEAKQKEDPSLQVKDVDALLNTLEACLTHPTFYREAREDFYTLKQKPGENTTRYFSRITKVYKAAEFPENTDFLVVDKLIHGCLNQECKRKLMDKEKTIKVPACLELMRKFESVDATMKKFGESATASVNAASARDPTRQSQKKGGRSKQHRHQSKPTEGSEKPGKKCPFCGGEPHSREKCPARNATCNYCHKVGHFQKACITRKLKRKKKVHAAMANLSSGESDSDSDLDLGIMPVTVHAVKSKEIPSEVFAPVQFHCKASTPQKSPVEGKVDTGAMVSIIPVKMLGRLGLSKQHLQKSREVVKGVSGEDLGNMGTIRINVTCNGKEAEAEFYVMKKACPFILGNGFCKKFNLVELAPVCIVRSIVVEQIDAVTLTPESAADYTKLRQKWAQHLPIGKRTGDPLEDLKLIFPDAFDGTVGLFPGELELKLSPDAQPMQLGPRSVPLSVHKDLRKHLDDMDQQQIIRECPETTEWVHNLVHVRKKNGSLRVCLDPRSLNKHLVRNVHYTASWEDALHSFKDGKFFSTLDAKSGYWTKKLSPASQLLTAFNTPFGKYCFSRMPFGLSVSAEIFCREMDKALDGIPGTFPCADDVKVQGSTEERHDLHLLETIDRARAAGLKFNPDKCSIKKDEIEYFGRIVNRKGTKPCPKKVRDLKNAAAPVDKQELQSLIGSVNFMSVFIPNLSKKTHLMRKLLKKDAAFVWTSDMQKELETVKEAICQATQLIHFDPSKPAIIQTDASLKGLGAVLLQDGKPVRFLSKSLTKTETDYANIERELLAILFAVEKLHNYTFGREIEVHTDHKPLEAIFLKPISLAPARLQRMLLRLRKYQLTVKYVGAKSVLLADTLSRLVHPGQDKTIPGLDVTIAQVLKIGATTKEILQEGTKEDSALKQLHDLIMNGFPDSMQDLPEELHYYWPFRDELTVMDGIILKGNRTIIPETARVETLKRLHDAHQGLQSTLQRARRSVFWPKLQNDIEDMITNCNECQQHGSKKIKQPERQVSATHPMEILGMDLLDFKGKTALMTIDYHSGYIMYHPLEAETTAAVKKALNNIFRHFGLARTIISDNGPCFKSKEFAEFCSQLDIGHKTSSPHYPQSNGRAERAVGTMKRILKRSKNDEEITNALIAFNDTPISDTLPSPGELFLNRRPITRLGMTTSPSLLSDQQKEQLHTKRSAHLKPGRDDIQYTPNQPVYFTDKDTEEWKEGTIHSHDVHPHAFWLINKETSRLIRRNKHDIKPRSATALKREVIQQQAEIADSITEQIPEAWLQTSKPSPPPASPVKPALPAVPNIKAAPPSPVPNPAISTQQPPSARKPKKPREPSVPSQPEKKTTKSGREIKAKKDPNFVY